MINFDRRASLWCAAVLGAALATAGAIEANAQDGSRSFDQALYDLYRGGLITLDEALRQADSANNLRIRIKLESAGQSAAEKPQFSLRQEDQF